ncbi:MAG: hypothetical protein JXR03_14060 [Cyclobacteriaceae bacterium]
MLWSKTEKIDALNFLLMVLSLLIAINVPFYLFFISYSVLGPLHYLTEIHWLDKNSFFISSGEQTKRTYAVIGFILPAIIILFIYSSPQNSFLTVIHTHITNFDILILAAILLASILAFLKNLKLLVLGIFACYGLAFAIHILIPELLIVIGVFLPSIIHIYFFTLLFMLYGARRSKSNLGLINTGVLAFIPMIIFIMPIDVGNYSLSETLKSTFLGTRIISVNEMVAALIFQVSAEEFNSLTEVGIRIQVFISFAYTYHYLNWFSKTSIIGWNKSMSRTKTIWIVLIWIMAVALYSYNFTIGFSVLFYLGTIHVILEFPLNIKTLKALISKG